MSLCLRFAFAVFVLFIVGLTGRQCSAGDPAKHHLHIVSSDEREDHGYSNGVLLTTADHRPILSFSMHKPAKGKSRFVYLLIFKAPPGPREPRYDMAIGPGGNSAKVEGGVYKANVSSSIGLYGKRIEAAFTVEDDILKGGPVKDTLTIGGKTVKAGAPRVFLVDLTADKITYEPVKVDLPETAPNFLSDKRKENWSPALLKILEDMKRTSADVKGFLEPVARHSIRRLGTGSILKTFGHCYGGLLTTADERPVALFSLFKPTLGQPRYAYLILFKTPSQSPTVPPLLDAGGADRGSFTGNIDGVDRVAASACLKCYGKRVDAAYSFDEDPKTHALVKETLTIGGKVVNKGEPRVILVDLTAAQVTYRPVETALPSDLPDFLKDTDETAWSPILLRAIDRLRQNTPEVKAFLEGGK